MMFRNSKIGRCTSTFASPAAEQEAQAGCTLTGTYTNSNGLSACASVVTSSLNVPAGVTLDLTSLKAGATVTFTGTTTFGTKLWEGPLVLLTGTNLKLLSVLAVFAAVLGVSSAREQSPEAGCTLSGTYVNTTDLSACSTVVVSSLSVPAGVTLDLTRLKAGATVTFTGTTTFGTALWKGPLVLLSGSNLLVTGPGTLDGQGAWYWAKGTSIARPVFFRLSFVTDSTLTNFKLLNSPFRTFSVQDSTNTKLTGLTLDSSAGDAHAKNTDGFDLSRNHGVSITNNTVLNQDDCLAMQSSVNTLFSSNTCSGGHGISVGSIGGPILNASDIVQGLTVSNNKIINSDNGLRIKTIVNLQGLVTGVTYLNNVLTNVKNAIVLHSDYDKAQGGYTGSPTSLVGIKNITIYGLSGTAAKMFNILVNPSVVSDWNWSGITVNAKSKGTCQGQPSGITCP
ncbi:hypothetical protein AeMF1_006705 [Aphanomyces euteiches]|nr:hypothetical protein AeMF1_006705 [Aphanomyces euteiches]KAH9182139.1 hypothetical protein AeNC1_015884 [Aphanomyces euteiches]